MALFADLGPAALRRLLQLQNGLAAAALSEGLVADLLWLRRLDSQGEGASPEQARGLAGRDYEAWRRERQHADARLIAWAARLTRVEFGGVLYWYDAEQARAVSRPLALCLMQLFMDQARLQGRVQGLLEAAGHRLEVADFQALPGETDWDMKSVL